MKTLTPIRAKILEFVNRFVDDNGFPPTVREICEAVNLRSPSTVYFHLNVLKEFVLDCIVTSIFIKLRHFDVMISNSDFPVG